MIKYKSLVYYFGYNQIKFSLLLLINFAVINLFLQFLVFILIFQFLNEKSYKYFSSNVSILYFSNSYLIDFK